MSSQSRTLSRYRVVTRPIRESGQPPPAPAHPDIVVIGCGNSGESVTLRMQAFARSDGSDLCTLGINNDQLAPRPVPFSLGDGTQGSLQLDERLVLGSDNARNEIYDHPLLARRYDHLFRGISVFESYPRSGHGGHGHPVISALDLDVAIIEVLAFLRQGLRHLRGESTAVVGGSDWERRVAGLQRRQDAAQEKRILLIGGGCGAMGNAAHHLLPYLIRHILAELGISTYQLWGVILGPAAFTGLTPFVRHNYRALLQSIDHLARHGQRRVYTNDLEIAMQAPPYDRVFLLDDPTLPATGVGVSESELDTFLDRAALSMYLLTRGTIWQTVASHSANDDRLHLHDSQPRYLHTVQSAMTGVDRARLTKVLAARLQADVLAAFVQSLGEH